MSDPGKATIYSVADRAQVSIATVSRVLSGANRVSSSSRERVLAAVRELDYIPDRAARSLAVKRHHALGLVLPELDGYY
jgi:LacI family transcriptional regulator, galactose operon repressor